MPETLVEKEGGNSFMLREPEFEVEIEDCGPEPEKENAMRS
jgi:hypothetical protein